MGIKFKCPKCKSEDIKEVFSTYGVVVMKCKSCEYKANSVHFLVVK